MTSAEDKFIALRDSVGGLDVTLTEEQVRAEQDRLGQAFLLGWRARAEHAHPGVTRPHLYIAAVILLATIVVGLVGLLIR